MLSGCKLCLHFDILNAYRTPSYCYFLFSAHLKKQMNCLFHHVHAIMPVQSTLSEFWILQRKPCYLNEIKNISRKNLHNTHIMYIKSQINQFSENIMLCASNIRLLLKCQRLNFSWGSLFRGSWVPPLQSDFSENWKNKVKK